MPTKIKRAENKITEKVIDEIEKLENLRKSAPSEKETQFAKKVMDSLDKSPCSFLAIQTQINILKDSGYTRLNEGKSWKLKQGGKYFVTRNNSSLIAFQIPKNKEIKNFTFMTSHSDFPALKLKDNPEKIIEGKYTNINIEVYGGAIYHTWFDKPLSITGRALVKTSNGVKTKFVNIDRDLLIIPSVAKHQHREVNDGFKINPQVDMLPLFGNEKAGSLKDIVAESINVKTADILELELYTYNRQTAKIWGANNEYVSSRAIDDQGCVFCSLYGFLEAKPTHNIPVHAVFDNEEIGSTTRQGAASTFLPDVLSRIKGCLDISQEDFYKILACSFGAMADNAHAIHPNHTETTDPNMRPYMGGGVVLKHSASFNYTTDAASGAIADLIAEKNKIKMQKFFNRSDFISGSALGRFLVPTVSPLSADVGLAQLAMHSSYETCSVSDLWELKNFAKGLFGTSIEEKEDGHYIVK